jgi:hypothetical protein
MYSCVRSETARPSCETERENLAVIKMFIQKHKVLPNTVWETIIVGKCGPRCVNRFEVRVQNFKNQLQGTS